MSTAIVTGGTGFVGSHLVHRLVRDGMEVHVLSRSGEEPRRLRDIQHLVRLHQGDLADGERVRTIVTSIRPAFVFHLAAAPLIAGSSADSESLVNTNLLGTVNLLSACEEVDYRCFLHTGDAFEYGPGAEALSETGPCCPDTLHGITRLAATLHARALAQTLGRPIVAFRLFSVYGPGDHPSRLIPRVIAAARNNAPLPLSRPEVSRDWVYVEDVVDLYLEACRKPKQVAGRIFNAGSGVKGTIADIVSIVLGLTGSPSEARWGSFPAAPHDAHPWVADMRRTFAAFEWRPRTCLQSGLERTIESMATE